MNPSRPRSPRARGLRWREENGIYILIFILAAAVVLLLLGDYSATWMHPELPARDIPNALKNGNGYVPGDILRGLDYMSFDGFPRARFLSYAFQIANIKFRVWLFARILPHPSLSLTWIFSLLLSPILLYRLVCNLTGRRIAAWAGLSLYCLSTGFLSGVVLLFHPGKPLTNFAAILCLYLASLIVVQAKKEAAFRRRLFRSSLLLPTLLAQEHPPGSAYGSGFARSALSRISQLREYARRADASSLRIVVLAAALLLAEFASFFLDEYAWFIFLAVPILAPGAFSLPRRRGLFLLAYLSLPICFFIAVTFLAPAAHRRLGFGEFNYWKSVFTPTYDNQTNIWNQLRTPTFLRNGRGLIGSQLLHYRGPGRYPLSRGETRALAAICLYGLLLFALLPAPRRRLLLRTALVLFLFALYHSLILCKHLKHVDSSFYYGSLFSVFLALFLSVLFSVEKKWAATVNLFLLPALLAVFIINFIRVNDCMIRGHDNRYRYHFPKETERMRGTVFTRALVRRAWAARGDARALFDLQAAFPLRGYWLFKELEHIDRLHPNLLVQSGATMAASSESLSGGEVGNLIDGDGDTFWHVALERVGALAWVTVDFGEDQPHIVRSISARPRRDKPDQFLRNSELLGSIDGKEWTTVSPIVQASPPGSEECRIWTFNNDRAYRYYRLAIAAGHAGGEAHHFYSLAELGMFE